jgi:hypothetical protein
MGKSVIVRMEQPRQDLDEKGRPRGPKLNLPLLIEDLTPLVRSAVQARFGRDVDVIIKPSPFKDVEGRGFKAEKLKQQVEEMISEIVDGLEMEKYAANHR